MMTRCSGLAAVLVMAGTLTLSGTTVAAASSPDKLDASLVYVLEHATPDEMISAILYCTAQTDLDVLGSELTAARARRGTRHRAVVSTLRDTAHASQAPLLAELEALQDAGRIHSYQPLWIVNAVQVEASAAEIAVLAGRIDVHRAYADFPITNTEPVPGGGPAFEVAAATGPEPGLDVIRAPEVWAQGFTGEGVLVASIDTGVEASHPALNSRWRGHDPRYAGNPEWAFFDPFTHWQFPQDSNRHGTHTMGTICGGLPGDQIGVAPGAEWVSAAVIERGGASDTIAGAIRAMQWMLDPDGDPTTSFDVPDVCCNSWNMDDDAIIPQCDALFWTFIDACEEAGTVIIFSAGNQGFNGLGRPADRATDEYRTVATAAVDGNNPSLPVASFSARGPTYCTPSGFPAIKPDIAAPGVDVRSAATDGTYRLESGTSMAAPHIVGVVALMREAAPDLAVDEIKQILYDTAVDLGAPGKDNNYGWGVVDAYAAVQRALETSALTFAFPDGQPELIDPNGGETVRVTVSGTNTPPVPGTGKLHYGTGSGFVAIDMAEVSANAYDAVFPAFTCGADVSYYFSVETENGGIAFDPWGAPGKAYVAHALTGYQFAFHDDFETDQGWIVSNSPTLTSGAWERGTPVPLDAPRDIPFDADGSGQCFMTGVASRSNVDGGTTTLFSPVMDATAIEEPVISYWRWYANGPGFGGQQERFYVFASENGGSSWIQVEIVGPTGDQVSGGWVHRSYRVADLVNVTSGFRIAFQAADTGSPSPVKAGVDGVAISSGFCTSCSAADLDGSGDVGFGDLTQLLGAWGPCGSPCPEDVDGDGDVGFTDLTALLGFWGPCT
jgi:subtilisin family serine protease